MSDILTHSQAYQSSSAPTVFSDQLAFGTSYQASSQACIIDLTAPTFTGISYLKVESRGQIRAQWAVATDPTAPIRYEVYIKASTATGLFTAANIIAITDKLQYDTFQMPDGSFLVNGTTYYVGVRAIDGVNNRDGNTVTMSVISTGVYVSAEVYKSEGTFTVGTNNMFEGTMWILKNFVLGIGSALGTASYQVYDKSGNPVSGMNQSGIAADSNGQFKLTPVISGLLQSLAHYVVKVSIVMDGDTRVSYVPIVEQQVDYENKASYAINNNTLVASFWATGNGEFINNISRLGAGSVDYYDDLGNLLPISETGIMPAANGLYQITPVPLTTDDISGYKAVATVIVDGLPKTSIIPATSFSFSYETKAIFSINALNQLQATFWLTKNGVVTSTGLGIANYTVYDKNGTAVSGLTQSGIIADINGRFNTTPISAILLTDLTHYTVKIGIVLDGAERIAYRGFTLLGT